MRCLWAAMVLMGLLAHAARAEVQVGEVPAAVVLEGKLGGRLDGSPWRSEEIRGKVHVLFYVDPDKKDLNNEASEALKAADFPAEKYQSIGIINMAATWMPNFAIASALKKKQKRYPTTIYVRDNDKALVKAWGISDDDSDILAFDKQGRLVFRRDGRLTAEDIEALLRKIREHLED